MGTNTKTTATDFKRTKILATVGPVTSTPEAIDDLMAAGVNGFRLNMSHGTPQERTEQIGWIREASKKREKPVTILADLQGPKIRLGDFEGVLPVQEGGSYSFKKGADLPLTGQVPLQYDISKYARRGDRMLIADGRIHMLITSVKDGVVYATAENDGELQKRKGINLPDTDFMGAIITKKDKADIHYIATQDIDYVALSFVQTAGDIDNLKKLLKNAGSDTKVIAKVETRAATENITEIVEASDGIMIARGDLALEVEPEAVPMIQRKIVGLCIEQAKISIVATQMLVSMTDNLEPTRAEVSDVATAVIIGADCLMLSEETASGKHPNQAVAMMKRIILYTQQNSPLKPVFYREGKESTQSAISSAIITLAHQVGAVAIVAETKSGATARSISSHRPAMPIIVVASEQRVANQNALLYGSKSYVRPINKQAASKLTDLLRKTKVFKEGDIIVTASGKQPGVVGQTDTIKVRVLE